MGGGDLAVGYFRYLMDHPLVGRRVSWDVYYPKTVCHHVGEVISLIIREDGEIQLLVKITDSMGNTRLKRVSAEEVKVLPLPEYSQKTNLIVDRLGKMGVIMTCEMRDAIEDIVAKNG